MNRCQRCGAVTVCVDCYPDSDAAKMLPPFVWTDVKPTVPGWYWYRESASEHPDSWEIVDYRDGEIIDEDGFIFHPDEFTGQFAGPIPQPEEPK